MSCAVRAVDWAFTCAVLHWDDHLLSLDLADASHLAWNTQKLWGSKQMVDATWCIGLFIFVSVTLLTYRICSIRLHQLSRCPGGRGHVSGCVWDCMCVGRGVSDVGVKYTHRLTIQGVERRTSSHSFLSDEDSAVLLTGILFTLIIRGDICIVDLCREAEAGWHMRNYMHDTEDQVFAKIGCRKT